MLITSSPEARANYTAAVLTLELPPQIRIISLEGLADIEG